jgi:hypothetical protein
VTKFAFVDSKKPAADTLIFKAVVDVGRASLGYVGCPYLRIREVGGTGAVYFSTRLPETSIKRAVKGTSKHTVTATLRKLDLPDLSGHPIVTLEFSVDDAIVAQTVRLTKGAFNGATANVTSPLFHVDSLKTRIVKGVPNYTVKGRLASTGAVVGTGTLDVSLGAFRVRESMSATKPKGRLTTFKSAGALRSLTIDPVKGTFAMVVATTADVRSGGTAVDVSLRLGENGFFGATSIVPAGSVTSPTY